MTCERCSANVDVGRLVVRRAFAGFACHGCAEEIRRIEWEERIMARKNGKAVKVNVRGAKKAGSAKAADREGSLAAIIDPMLATGQSTVKEIAAELAKTGGDAAKGRDLEANVRARLVAYRRKGWQVLKDEQKRVKLVPAAA